LHDLIKKLREFSPNVTIRKKMASIAALTAVEPLPAPVCDGACPPDRDEKNDIDIVTIGEKLGGFSWA
jgi:hypothetical protein